MSAVKVVRHQMVNNVPLTAKVSIEQIVAGWLPQKIDLPATAINHVSTVRGADVAQGASPQRTSRVQVTVMAKSYPELEEVFQLVVDALPTVRGTVAGVDVDSILPGLIGPDFGDDDVGLYMRSYDVTVTYSL